MSDLFCDTSAIAKRYLAEVGSGWVGHLAAPGCGNQVWLGQTTPIEFVSAVARRWRDGLMTLVERDGALAAFKGDASAEYEVMDLTDDVGRRASDLLLVHALRAFDAVQLASALALNEVLVAFGLDALVFVCADDRLLAAASAEGLAIDNPLNHP